MKKLIALLLCALTVVGLLGGCKKDDDKNKNSGKDGKTITIGIPTSTLVMDYKENALTKWVEEQTGYELEFQKFAAASADYGSQLSTMAAAGMDLPDILTNFDLGDEVYNQYGEDGFFINLAPYFEDKEGKSKVWWDRFNELDETYQANLVRRMTNDDGEIFGFPTIQTSLIDIQDFTPWINTAWLDAVGMEKPTNIDELYKVLVAFKTKDPNGNGKTDEIPLCGATSLCGDAVAWVINMFCYLDETIHFNIDDNGKLYLPEMTDEYREALKFVNKLIKEDLLPAATLNTTQNEIKTLVTPTDGVAQVGIVVCHPTLGFTQDHKGILDYEALPLWGNAVYNEDQNFRRTFITSDCEDPDAAWEVLMCLSSLEGSIRMRYGDLGKDWDWADEGAVSFMGVPAQYKLHHDVWSTQGTDNWRSVCMGILVNAEQEGAQITGEISEVTQHKYNMFLDMKASYDKQAAEYNPKNICPLLVRNSEEKEATDQLRSDCIGYISTSRSKFITGATGFDINSDADWQAYLNKLKELRVEQWVAVAQGIYERDYK